MMKATIAAMAANGPMAGPKSSMAITDAASGALAAPASSATMPMAANIPGSSPPTWASALPAVAPTKKIGVTMPPLPPVPSETAVNRIFSSAASGGTGSPRTAASSVGSPRPRYRSEVSHTPSATTVPPAAATAQPGTGSRWARWCVHRSASINKIATRPKTTPARRVSMSMRSVGAGSAGSAWWKYCTPSWLAT